MSRQIDKFKPLSDEDRAWLESNARFDIIREVDANTGGTPLDPSHSIPDEKPGESPDAVPASPAAVLRAQAEAAANGGSAQVPDQAPDGGLAADQPTQPTEPGEPVDPTVTVPATEPTVQAGDGGEDDEDEGDNYDDEDVWSYQDLVDEYKDRVENHGLEKGPKYNAAREDVIAYLRKDDESD